MQSAESEGSSDRKRSRLDRDDGVVLAPTTPAIPITPPSLPLHDVSSSNGHTDTHVVHVNMSLPLLTLPKPVCNTGPVGTGSDEDGKEEEEKKEAAAAAAAAAAADAAATTDAAPEAGELVFAGEELDASTSHRSGGGEGDEGSDEGSGEEGGDGKEERKRKPVALNPKWKPLLPKTWQHGEARDACMLSLKERDAILSEVGMGREHFARPLCTPMGSAHSPAISTEWCTKIYPALHAALTSTSRVIAYFASIQEDADSDAVTALFAIQRLNSHALAELSMSYERTILMSKDIEQKKESRKGDDIFSSALMDKLKKEQKEKETLQKLSKKGTDSEKPIGKSKSGRSYPSKWKGTGWSSFKGSRSAPSSRGKGGKGTARGRAGRGRSRSRGGSAGPSSSSSSSSATSHRT
jgi:hypothetical protein